MRSHLFVLEAVLAFPLLFLIVPLSTHAATYSNASLLGPPGCNSTSATSDGSGGMKISCHGIGGTTESIIPQSIFSVTVTSGGVSKNTSFSCSGNTAKEGGATPECQDSTNITVGGENLTIYVDSLGYHYPDPSGPTYAFASVTHVSCATGYTWNGTDCSPVTYSCTGSVPSNTVLYSDYNTGLTKDTPYTFADPETGKCQYKCSSGYAWNGSSCAPQYSCLGTVPTNATLYSGDDTNLSASTNYKYSSTNTSAKCEYSCNTGYTYSNGSCVLSAPPTYSCTTPPTVPANATVYTGDDVNLTANTPYSYSDTNSPAKCEYHCDTGYDSVWDSTKAKYVCQIQAAGPDLIASSIFPTSASVNETKTFSSTITNQGDVGTGGKFNVFFQQADYDSVRKIYTNIRDFDPATSFVQVNGLAAGASEPAPIAHTFTSAGTYYVRACADKKNALDSGLIAESVETNNCGEYTQITINDNTPKPDLVASGITPTSATINQPVSLSSTITNQGNTSTGTGFTNLWQQADDLAGKNTRDLTNSSSNALDSGQSAPTSISKTFTTAGAYFFRVCADSNNSIVESDNGNNCGPYTEVDVSDQACTGDNCGGGCTGSNCGGCTGNTCTGDTKITVTLWADSYNVNKGESTDLHWQASANAKSCQGNIPGFSTGYTNPISGKDSTGPLSADSPYQIQCKGDQNNYSDPAAVLIKVNPVNVTIDANPPRVKKAGEFATIHWTASDNAKGCVVSGPGITVANKTEKDGPLDISQAVTINAPSRYTIDCNGNAAHADVTVNIVPDYNEF